MIRYAFKEWASIVQALGSGQQAIILRKGGIAEEGGVFRPDHARFWLYPTYAHQKPEALRGTWPTEGLQRSPQGVLQLRYYAEVPVAYHVVDLDRLNALEPCHVWSRQTIAMRFQYRTPGLFVLPVRIYELREPLEVPDLPEYEGCKTWVDLGRDYAAEGSPVLTDEQFARVVSTIERVLR